METFASPAAIRARLKAARQAGRSVGLVPTMGYLHHGHMELVRRARRDNDLAVVSIFVNPLQFGPSEDFARYPRDMARDVAMLEAGNVDVLFAPAVEDMYPQPIETSVDLPKLGSILEGKVRPGHFSGVATVVTKLLNIVGPDRAYFGEKDYQQLQVIRRMVADLDMPVQIVGVPTVREADGLAASSRNVYLSPAERQAASVIARALAAAERTIENGERRTARLVETLRGVLAQEPLALPELVEVRAAGTLDPVGDTLSARIVIILYVSFGRTRLLDQREIDVPASPRVNRPLEEQAR